MELHQCDLPGRAYTIPAIRVPNGRAGEGKSLWDRPRRPVAASSPTHCLAVSVQAPAGLVLCPVPTLITSLLLPHPEQKIKDSSLQRVNQGRKAGGPARGYSTEEERLPEAPLEAPSQHHGNC